MNSPSYILLQLLPVIIVVIILIIGFPFFKKKYFKGKRIFEKLYEEEKDNIEKYIIGYKNKGISDKELEKFVIEIMKEVSQRKFIIREITQRIFSDDHFSSFHNYNKRYSFYNNIFLL